MNDVNVAFIVYVNNKIILYNLNINVNYFSIMIVKLLNLF